MRNLRKTKGSFRTTERAGVACQLAEAFNAQLTALPFAFEGSAEAITVMQQCDREFREKVYREFLAASAGSTHIK